MYNKIIKLIIAVGIFAFAIYQFIEGYIGNGIMLILLSSIFVFLYFKNEFILLAFLRLRKQDFPGATKWLNKIKNPESALVKKQQGYFNYLHGIMVSQTNMNEAEKYFKKGISVSTIGVGQGYNAALLSMISKFSGGLEHQAIASEGITQAMDKEFESLLYPVASNLKVKVKYNNRIIYKTLYGVPESKNSDNMVQFNLEKVYSSLNRMALMKFKIENPDKDIDKNVISIEISYFDEQKKQPVKIIKETHLEWTDETDAELIADRELKETYSIAVVNQAYKVLADLCDGLKYTDAKKTINQTLRSLKDVNSDKYTAELVPIIEELSRYLKALDRAIINGVK